MFFELNLAVLTDHVRRLLTRTPALALEARYAGSVPVQAQDWIILGQFFGGKHCDRVGRYTLICSRSLSPHLGRSARSNIDRLECVGKARVAQEGIGDRDGLQTCRKGD